MVDRTITLTPALDKKLVAKAATLNRTVDWVILRSLEVALEGENIALGRAVMRGTSRGRKESKC